MQIHDFILTALDNLYIMARMNELSLNGISITVREGAGMSVLRSSDALEILKSAYEKGDGSDTVPKRWDLRQEQIEMIRALSERYNESQVTVLRSIIDEWRDMKLREARQ
jgi:hypothetical protein